MTQKERIEQLEREVKDLRALVDVLRASTPYVPFTPQPYRPKPWPGPYTTPVYHNTCEAS